MWAQTVGAQWLFVNDPNAATIVTLVQTASTLPMMLLALPSGVLADAFDRRWLMFGVQAYFVAVAVLLAVLTAAGMMPPALLLTFTFAVGAGGAMLNPAWQSLITELVPRNELAAATRLDMVSVNVARAAGPALAGLVIARWGVPPVFALTAVCAACPGRGAAGVASSAGHARRAGTLPPGAGGRWTVCPSRAGGPADPASLGQFHGARLRGVGPVAPDREPAARPGRGRLRAALRGPRPRCRGRRPRAWAGSSSTCRPTGCWAWQRPPSRSPSDLSSWRRTCWSRCRCWSSAASAGRPPCPRSSPSCSCSCPAGYAPAPSRSTSWSSWARRRSPPRSGAWSPSTSGSGWPSWPPPHWWPSARLGGLVLKVPENQDLDRSPLAYWGAAPVALEPEPGCRSDRGVHRVRGLRRPGGRLPGGHGVDAPLTTAQRRLPLGPVPGRREPGPLPRAVPSAHLAPNTSASTTDASPPRTRPSRTRPSPTSSERPAPNTCCPREPPETR